MIGGTISLSEPFTPFTALNNKGNPVFGPFTRVKGCDPEIVNDFSEVNRVKGYRRIKGRATRSLCPLSFPLLAVRTSGLSAPEAVSTKMRSQPAFSQLSS